jgi:hypothetical protein
VLWGRATVHRIAGGSVLTYTLASVALGAGVLMLALPRVTSWWGIANTSVMCVCGGLLAITIAQNWTTLLPMSSRIPTGPGSWTDDGEPPGPVAPLRGLPTV